MKIGIIGPNKIFEGSREEREKLLDKTAKIIAESKNEIILTPDKDSLLEYFGKKYLEFGGKKIYIVAPMEDKAEEYLNLGLGEVIDCDIWDKQADEFNRQSDAFICIGWAWGAMKEIACAQYFNKKKIYVVKDFISEELPKELNFLVEYIGIEKLESVLRSLSKRKDAEDDE